MIHRISNCAWDKDRPASIGVPASKRGDSDAAHGTVNDAWGKGRPASVFVPAPKQGSSDTTHGTVNRCSMLGTTALGTKKGQ